MRFFSAMTLLPLARYAPHRAHIAQRRTNVSKGFLSSTTHKTLFYSDIAKLHSRPQTRSEVNSYSPKAEVVRSNRIGSANFLSMYWLPPARALRRAHVAQEVPSCAHHQAHSRGRLLRRLVPHHAEASRLEQADTPARVVVLPRRSCNWDHNRLALTVLP